MRSLQKFSSHFQVQSSPWLSSIVVFSGCWISCDSHSDGWSLCWWLTASCCIWGVFTVGALVEEARRERCKLIGNSREHFLLFSLHFQHFFSDFVTLSVQSFVDELCLSSVALFLFTLLPDYPASERGALMWKYVYVGSNEMGKEEKNFFFRELQREEIIDFNNFHNSTRFFEDFHWISVERDTKASCTRRDSLSDAITWWIRAEFNATVGWARQLQQPFYHETLPQHSIFFWRWALRSGTDFPSLFLM